MDNHCASQWDNVLQIIMDLDANQEHVIAMIQMALEVAYKLFEHYLDLVLGNNVHQRCQLTTILLFNF
jgi:hypothetical protein